MKTIWKFEAQPDTFSVALPVGAKVLSCALQHGKPVFWALVDPTAPRETRMFRAVGTGWPLPANTDSETFIGTFQLMAGDLVFHLFELSKG